MLSFEGVVDALSLLIFHHTRVSTLLQCKYCIFGEFHYDNVLVMTERLIISDSLSW